MKYIFPYFRMEAANADGTTTGGSSGTTTTETTDGGNTPSEVDQLKEQLAKEKKDRLAAAAKVTELSQAVEKLKTTSLKTQGDYKTMFEQSEQKITLLEQERDKLKESIFHTTRVSAVKDEAVKLGLRPKAMAEIEGMDLDEVEVKVGDDKIIRVDGAKTFAERLKATKDYLFETPKDPKFNGGGGGGGGGNNTGSVSDEQLQAAYRARNSSPEKMQAYQAVRKSYDEQTRKAKTK